MVCTTGAYRTEGRGGAVGWFKNTPFKCVSIYPYATLNIGTHHNVDVAQITRKFLLQETKLANIPR